MFEHVRTVSASGASQSLYRRLTHNAPRAVVQINHGLAEHAARYGGFAEELAAAGFHVYAQDHRGHGHTQAPDAPLGSFGAGRSLERVIADIGSVHDMIAAEHPGLPVIVFGHSMGSLLATRFVQLHSQQVAGAAFWNGNASAGLAGRAAQAVLAWERFRLGSDAASQLLPRLTFGAWARCIDNRRTDFDWLARDPRQVDLYIADPLCGWAPSVGMWRDIFDLIFLCADDGNFSAVRKNLPINLVGGADDPATFDGKAVLDMERRLHRMGFSNLKTTIYPQTRHESLNEFNRDIIVADFIAWAVEVAASTR